MAYCFLPNSRLPVLINPAHQSREDAQRPGHGERHRKVSTLLNPRTVGAMDLIVRYHERWEIETTIDDIDTHQRLCDYTLRSQTPEGVEQELYGILLGYYAVRALMLQPFAGARGCPPKILFLSSPLQAASYEWMSVTDPGGAHHHMIYCVNNITLNETMCQ